MDVRHLLPHLHYFWLVAKHKSLSRAAEELGVSPSAISYQIRSLEDKIKSPLFKRDNGQRAELTNFGRQVASGCQKIFTQVDDVFDEILNQEANKQLKVTAPVSYANYILLPAIHQLVSEIRDAEFNLHITDAVLDVFEGNIDIAIRNVPADNEMECVELMRVKHVAITSEKYLRDAPPVRSIEDLKDHHLVCITTAMTDWARVQRFYPTFQMPSEADRDYISTNFSIVEAVHLGMGVALVPDYVADSSDLAGKDIIRVLDNYFTDTNIELMDTLYVCYPKLSMKSAVIQKFIIHFKAYLEKLGKIVL